MKIEKICEFCNSTFEVEYKRRDKKYCNRKCYFEHARSSKKIGRKKEEDKYEIRKCNLCNSEFEVRKKVRKKLCSDKCRKEWGLIDENKQSRLDKSRKACQEIYGVDTTFQSIEFQKKIRDGFEKKYGVRYAMHHEPFKEKLKSTYREKHLEKLLPKLKEHDLILLDDYTTGKDAKNSTSITYRFQCIKCEHIFTSTVMGSGKIPICRKCVPIQKNSSLETIITDFLNENKIKFISSDRKILGGKEIDILLPEKNIGIEINGNYWHTELFGDKDKFYHIEKTKLAKEAGINLIHIYEDEILFKRDIVISRLKNKLGLISSKIYARKCNIKEVSFKDKKEFLEKNHIQGNSVDNIRLGLYYNNELVSLITFSKKRSSLGQKHENNEWELNRFASKLNHNVLGGFSKLLKYFIKKYTPKKIITYSDIRWSGLKENVYMSTDFSNEGLTPPNYWYVKKGQYLHRHHRYSFRKSELIKEGHDVNKTEWQIMQEKGYDRIWDCGNNKYIMSF